MPRVASLHVYPLKGARALDLASSALEPRGLAHDRRFVATDTDGVCLTQRNCPSLARIVVLPSAAGMSFGAAGRGEILVIVPPDGPRERIRVWRSEIDAGSAGVGADAWLSRALGRDARLWFMDALARRDTPGDFGPASPVSFADGYPVLLTTSGSLAALNERIIAGGGAGVRMERFRPNLVIDGADPWAEDAWSEVRVGDAVIELVKPCARCVVTTLDQAAGDARGREPLESLVALRKSADPRVPGVVFGWNGIIRRTGVVTVGDPVEVSLKVA